MIVCIEVGSWLNHLTQGKSYEILREHFYDGTYQITDDSGNKHWYCKTRFESQDCNL